MCQNVFTQESDDGSRSRGKENFIFLQGWWDEIAFCTNIQANQISGKKTKKILSRKNNDPETTIKNKKSQMNLNLNYNSFPRGRSYARTDQTISSGDNKNHVIDSGILLFCTAWVLNNIMKQYFIFTLVQKILLNEKTYCITQLIITSQPSQKWGRFLNLTKQCPCKKNTRDII